MTASKADWHFDDDNKALPLWRVKHQDASTRIARFPFFKHETIVRAESRLAAIAKVQTHYSGHDRFSGSVIR